VGARDGGRPVICAETVGPVHEAGNVLEQVHKSLAEKGVANLLDHGAVQ
jgi:hypothetical protein